MKLLRTDGTLILESSTANSIKDIVHEALAKGLSLLNALISDTLISVPLISDPLFSDPLISLTLISDPLISDPLISVLLISDPLISDPLISPEPVWILLPN